jgi:hypothetical protein
MAAKKKEKRTFITITTVQDQYLSFATFRTPVFSHWSLPLYILMVCYCMLQTYFQTKNGKKGKGQELECTDTVSTCTYTSLFA